MTTVSAMVRRLQGLNIQQQAEQAIEENKEIIADLNVQQFKEGKRSDGSFLPDYSPVSVSQYGKPPGPIKLFDTGDFYRGVFARVEGPNIFIDSTDPKTAELEKRYISGTSMNDGAELFGLSGESKSELIKDLQPTLVTNVKKELKL